MTVELDLTRPISVLALPENSHFRAAVFRGLGGLVSAATSSNRPPFVVIPSGICRGGGLVV